jgi:hypothetical protein
MDYIRQRFLQFESLGAVVISASGTVWYSRFGGIVALNDLLESDRTTIYSTLVTTFGTLLGFTIAAASIVLAFSNVSRMAALRESSHYVTLWRVFRAATWSLAVATALAFLSLVGDRDTHPNPVLMWLCFTSSLIAVAYLSNCLWVFDRVLTLLTDPSKARSGIDP